MKILILGGSSVIGEALVDSLKNLPNSVLGIHFFAGSSKIEHWREPLKHSPSRIEFFQGDLTSQKACHGTVDKFVEWAGGIDGLVQLTGGVSKINTLESIRENDWHRDIALNLSGPLFAAQKAIQYMAESNNGRIVFTSTASVRHGGGSDTVAYGAAKAGLEFVTRSLAKSGAPNNILVNAVAPGFIQTGFHQDALGRTVEELERRVDLIPLKRPGLPQEVARAIKFLLFESSSYITGEVIAISGGDWL